MGAAPENWLPADDDTPDNVLLGGARTTSWQSNAVLFWKMPLDETAGSVLLNDDVVKV